MDLDELELALRLIFSKICARFSSQRARRVREAEIDSIVEKCVWPDFRRSGLHLRPERLDESVELGSAASSAGLRNLGSTRRQRSADARTTSTPKSQPCPQRLGAACTGMVIDEVGDLCESI